MKSMKVTSAEDYKNVSNFLAVRKTLLEDRYADRLEKPLAFWALPNDRRLPLAFLDRTIKDLLSTPFEELTATPGIGQKKITSLVRLLNRATKDHPPAVPPLETELKKGEKLRRNGRFDPSVVSEALWAEWQETVRKHGVGHEKLGRLAPTLQALPTVIWNTPLETYLPYTVAQIRQLKTHGEKRVRAILEVFYVVNESLSPAGNESPFAVRLVPRFIEPIERWIEDSLARPGVPKPEEVREQFTIPLLEQIKIDAGDQIHDLAAGRLGVYRPAESVRHQSKALDVTRARVYQLLEDCARVMLVRWPEGEQLLNTLAAKIETEATFDDDFRLFRATKELFFPGKNKLRDHDDSREVEIGATHE